MDTIECFRDLSLIEWNFREILSSKLVSLLRQQRRYWKQWGKINWVKEGDASTKYFHAHATITHRKNTIACLQDDSGDNITDHDGKAKILWESFKDRLGKTKFKEMLYNVNVLITKNKELNELQAPFSKQEIDSVISELPNNKSPRPDGYNNEFIKGCWPLITPDFYRLFEAFLRKRSVLEV